MDSKFTGGIFTCFFYKLAVCLVTLLTLGFCYPFIACGYWKWKANNTYINGLKMKFSGKVLLLFKKYVVWWAFCVITLGVYGILKLSYDIRKWKTEYTHIDGREERRSYLDANWYQLLRAQILSGLMIVLTLGIGYAWAHCAYLEWLCWHTYIDGNSFDFEGEGKKYFKKCALWILLSVTTLGIYDFWFNANIIKWDTTQTNFKFREKVIADKIVLITRPAPVPPQSVAAVNKPVMGEHFKRIYEYMMVKRAMICFTCEIPFIVCAALLMAFTIGSLTYIVFPLLLWFVVLLSLPAIFIVEERFKNVSDLKLKSAIVWSVTGLIFSLIIPIFLPVFIYGLLETIRLKEWVYGEGKIAENSPLTENGEAIILEQEVYFDMSKKYQIYIWDCGNYKKAVENYAKSMIEYNEKLKAYNDVLEKSDVLSVD